MVYFIKMTFVLKQIAFNENNACIYV